MRGEPRSPNDWWAQSFFTPDQWREEADKWESLANGASLDGDARHERYCSENAADCRHNARVRALNDDQALPPDEDGGS